MACLLLEVHFWTHSEDVIMRSEDVGAYKFHEKPDSSAAPSPHQRMKQTYAESRGIAHVLANTRRAPLRDSVRQLQQLLDTHRLVYQAWHHLNLLLLLLDSGALVTLWVDFRTGNIDRLLVDRTLVAKLGGERVVSAAFSEQLILLTHPESRLTLVTLSRPIQWQQWGRLSALQPRFSVWQLPGPSTRRAERRLALPPPLPQTAPQLPTVAVWWGGAAGEMQPWTPSGRDQDRANVLVYGLLPGDADAASGGGDGVRLELVSHCRTRHDPLLVQFSALRPNTLYTVEQSVTGAGQVVVEHSTYDTSGPACRQLSAVSIPLGAEVLSAALAPDERRLLLSCADSSLLMHDCAAQLTHMVKAPVTLWRAAWHPHSSLALVVSDTGELRCYDLALSPLELSLLGYGERPVQALRLGQYFRFKPRVSRLVACPEVLSQQGHVLQSFLLTFERGPLTLLCLQVSRPNRGRLYPSDIICEYVTGGRWDAAINLLTSLNWEQQGDEALAGLYMVVNNLLKLPLTPAREAQLEAALGSFLAPVRDLSESVQAVYGDRVRNISRRFFHHLLRHGCLEKAFRLALDLRDADLFSDVRAAALNAGHQHLAAAAQAERERGDSRSGSTSGSETDETSSCSTDCSSSWHSDEEGNSTELMVTDERPTGVAVSQTTSKPPPPLGSPGPVPPERPPKPAGRPASDNMLSGQRGQKPPLPPKPALPPKPPTWQHGISAASTAALTAQLSQTRLSQQPVASPQPMLPVLRPPTLRRQSDGLVPPPRRWGPAPSSSATHRLPFETTKPSPAPPPAFVTDASAEAATSRGFGTSAGCPPPGEGGESRPPRPLPRTLRAIETADNEQDAALVVHFV